MTDKNRSINIEQQICHVTFLTTVASYILLKFGCRCNSPKIQTNDVGVTVTLLGCQRVLLLYHCTYGV